MGQRFTTSVWLFAAVATGIGAWGCGGAAPAATASPDPATHLYDDFLDARTLAARLTAPQANMEAAARERKIIEDRSVLRNLEAGVASKRTLLADSGRDLPADSPNESVYFQIWSSHLGDGDKPLFRRLAGGGIEYAGKQYSKDAAVACAVPARLKGSPPKPFLDCLTTPRRTLAAR
jgi:hypothetical protein